MKSKLLTAAVLALAIAGISGDASAATVNFAPGATYTISTDYKPGNVDLNAVDLSTDFISVIPLANANLTLVDARIVNNSNTYGATAPATVGATDHFLAIYGNDLTNPFGATSGIADFTITSPSNYFAFEWGTIDADFNDISYVNGNNETRVIPGADVLAIALGSYNTGDVYFELFDAAGIKEVILSSAGVAFEVAKINIGNVPLPPALAMFGVALAGVFGIRSRNKKVA